MAISVVVNTKNSVKTLERALLSVSFASEVVVVDMQSTDGTPELARHLGATVFYHSDVGFVEPARQFAIQKAKYDWILVLDADEEISQSLAQKLIEISKTENEAVAYALPRKNILFDRWIEHAGWWPDYQIRFFRNGTVHWPSSIHGVPEVTGVVTELVPKDDLAIIHYNYDSISEFIQRMDRYTTIQASTQESSKQALTGKKLVAVFKNEFLRRCFADRGYESGTHGFALSFLQAFSELTVVLKRWEAVGFTFKPETESDLQALAVFRSELAYWLANRQVERKTGITRLWWQFRRKFRV